MPNAEELERRTAEYVEMLWQLRGAAGGAVPAGATLTAGSDPFEQEAFRAALDVLAQEAAAGRAAAEDSPSAARAALESADELLGTAAGIVERVVFRDTHVAGWHAGTVLEAARFDVASARRRLRAVLDTVPADD